MLYFWGKMNNIVKDIDIRRKLLNKTLPSIYKHVPDTRILQEFGICQGISRIDIAVVNGLLIGYEIKSAADTLERLPLQENIYSRIFDKVTLVASKNHTEKLEAIVPDWWGLWEARDTSAGVEIREVKEARNNTRIDAFALAQCLWRDEAIEILEKQKAGEHIRKAKRIELWEMLTKVLSIEELRANVRHHLKSRKDWSIVWPRMSGGD